jgi:hypothetical protein
MTRGKNTGGTNKKVTDEKGHYVGGRQEGRKNLKKVGDGYINQEGVRFTEQEKKRLESLVNSTNRKRKIMEQIEASLPRYIGGVDTHTKLGSKEERMGKESDFILAKKTKSLQRFKSKKEYDLYIKQLERVNDPAYLEKRVKQYQKNYIKALRKTFGAGAKEAVKAIKNMDWQTYMKTVQQDENLEISYVYDPKTRSWKLELINTALNVNTKDKYKGLTEEQYKEMMERNKAKAAKARAGRKKRK